MAFFQYQEFRFDGAFASEWHWPVIGVVAYLLFIGVLMLVMRSFEALKLPRITALHNLILSVGSLIMFLGTLWELVQRRAASGSVDWFFCEHTDTKAEGPLFFWSYIYYLSKYYEMLDTVLVIIQKSKVPHFKLQVYHHAAVVPMAWLWCQQKQTLQWGGLLFNTLVHVVMYLYYAMRVLQLPTPWKKWITKLQIVQFMTSFVALCVTATHLYAGAACAGMGSLAYNAAFNATLLLQFVGVDKRNQRLAGSQNGKDKDKAT
jgi:fatty acid elongase 3